MSTTDEGRFQIRVLSLGIAIYDSEHDRFVPAPAGTPGANQFGYYHSRRLARQHAEALNKTALASSTA